MTASETQALLDQLPDPVLIVRGDTIEAVNAAAAAALGWTAAELAGQTQGMVLRQGIAIRRDGSVVDAQVVRSGDVVVLRPRLPVHEINNELVAVLLGLDLIENGLTHLRSTLPADQWEKLRAQCQDAAQAAERVRTLLRQTRATPAKTEVAAAPRARARIFLVDDAPRLGATLSMGLREHADVIAAGSGREAVRMLLADEGFDLILCDLSMPDVSGMDVFQQVTLYRPELASRFVFITGGAVTERAHEFLQAPGRRWLAKPFRLEDIEALLPR